MCLYSNRDSVSLYKKIIIIIILITFSFTSVISPSYAQSITAPFMPQPGTMVMQSAAYVPMLLKGMTIYPDAPLKFDFIIDSGNSELSGEEIATESKKLVNYFLASMTVPKDELWVNLSPVEQDRIVPDALGKTELGRDLLAQDYLLKQLTASLMYPEKELGQKFWDRVYEKAQKKFGTTDIPQDAFSKVWILPESATVYEHGNTVYIVESKLKVMTDIDYSAMQNNRRGKELRGREVEQSLPLTSAQSAGPEAILQPQADTSQIIKEIIIPEIEKEVNTGENFAPLRQIYHSLILAKWYKETIKNSILNQVYVDKNKVTGLEIYNPVIPVLSEAKIPGSHMGDSGIAMQTGMTDEKTNVIEEIYAQYMEAYKKGVYNYIKEDYDPQSQQIIPKKYFSGGFHDADIAMTSTSDERMIQSSVVGQDSILKVELDPQSDQSKDVIPAKAGISEYEAITENDSDEAMLGSLKKGDMSFILTDYFHNNISYFTLVGKPGSGKGTVSEVMLDQLNKDLPEGEQYQTLVMGDIIRAIMKLKAAKGTDKENEVFAQFAEYVPFINLISYDEVAAMKRGELISDQTATNIVNTMLAENPRLKDAKRIFFDGFPRTQYQFDAMQNNEILHKGEPIKMDFYAEIDVPSKELIARVKRRAAEKVAKGEEIRPDDTPEKMKVRLKEYDTLTAPMVETLKKLPKDEVFFLSINGVTTLPENPKSEDIEESKAEVRNRLFKAIRSSLTDEDKRNAIVEVLSKRSYPFDYLTAVLRDEKILDQGYFYSRGHISVETILSDGKIDDNRPIDYVILRDGTKVDPKDALSMIKGPARLYKVKNRNWALLVWGDINNGFELPGKVKEIVPAEGNAFENRNNMLGEKDEAMTVKTDQRPETRDHRLNEKDVGGIDNAQTSDSATRGIDSSLQKEVGGIDLNNIDINRKGEANAIKFDNDALEPLLGQNITGFAPIIIDIVPLNSILPVLGLKDMDGKEQRAKGKEKQEVMELSSAVKD